MAARSDVEQLMNDMVRMGKAFGAMRTLIPTPFGVDNASIPLLLKLDGHPMRVGALAELVHSDISTISRQATALQRQGLVTKTPDPEDGRAQLLAITDEGREVAVQLRRQRCRLLTEVLRDWPPDKVAAASAAIKDFAEAIEFALNDDELRRSLPRLTSL